MDGPRDWDAATYDRVADPMTRWGLAVVDRLAVVGDETVLDAGCGSGRVTEQLAERLPRGQVVALDGSPSMVEEARRRLARFGDRITYVVADLGRPFALPDGSVDAILSTATFHWVADHDALFRNLAAVLRPGGRLVAQCGGAGNVEHFLDVVRAVAPEYHDRHNFQTPEATRRRLERSGFVEIETWLSDEHARFEPGPFEDFLETVCLRTHLAELSPEDRRPFVDAVAARMGEPVLDYVRLNIVA